MEISTSRTYRDMRGVVPRDREGARDHLYFLDDDVPFGHVHAPQEEADR
jgi:hypothetical protein